MLADIANKRKEGELFHPVVIVHQDCPVGNITFKVEEFCQLLFDRFLVMSQGLLIQQVAFCRLHGWVSYHSRSTSYKRYRCVARTLQVLEHHHTHQVPNM